MNKKKNAIRIGAVEFRNPVFLASGPAGYGLEYAGLIDLPSLGAVVTKTVSYSPRRGNPGRRLRETVSGLLNSVGLENVGAEEYFAEKLPPLYDAGVKPVVSLAAEDWEDYRKLLELTARQENVDVVELNLSCPNVERGGMAVGVDPDLVRRYVRLAKDILRGAAVLAKLTPNVQDIGLLALAAEEAGADGITAINTVLGMDIDTDSGKPVFHRIRAGLSGPAIMPVALEAVWRIRRRVEIPVIGVGGISSPLDAEKFFLAGATAIQIGTAIFYAPGLPGEILSALEERGIPAPINLPD